MPQSDAFNFQEYVSRLSQLVASPSVSCALPHLDMSNKPVIDLLANWLQDLGFSIEIMPINEHPGKFNLIATLGTGNGGLVLAGHSDTVPFDEELWCSNPFKLTERDNKLYGLGATDMKGFFPAVLAAVSSFKAADLKQPIIVLATADEESSMSGARALATADNIKARYAIIGEPTGLRPINMHKGIMMESVHVQGTSGHSSNPALGNNALETMHTVIQSLLEYRQFLQTNYQNPGFEVSVPTLNLGCIHGGDGANRICGACELHFDLRTLPGMDNQQLRRDIHTRLKPIAEACKTDLVFSSLFEGVEAFHQDVNSELVRACEALTGQETTSVAFATEAPFMKSLGMQTIILGPGSIDQAHQPDEYISIDQIDPAITTLRRLIHHFCIAETNT